MEIASHVVTVILSRSGMSIKGYPYHPYLGWRARIDDTYRVGGHCPYGESARFGYIGTNTQGLSITPLTFEKPDIKVAITGGSTMFGAGSSTNETTVPSNLEKMIRERVGIKAEVYNLAVPGYQSFQEMLGLYKFLKTDKVDLVLSISGRNDASYASKEQDIRSASLLSEVYERTALLNLDGKDNRPLSVAVSFMRAHSSTFDLMYSVWPKVMRRLNDTLMDENDPTTTKAMVNSKDNKVFDNIDKRTQLTALHYSMMNTLAKSNGAKYIMMLQPTAFTKKTLTLQEEKCSETRVWRDVRVSNRLLKDYEHAFFARFKKVPKSYAFTDLTNIFDHVADTVYVDMCHYNDAGAFIVAQAVLERIEPLLRQFKSNLSLNLEGRKNSGL